MKVWNAFCNGLQRINKLLLYFAVICIVTMTGLVTIEIIARTLFDKSTLIADEYTGYLLVAMTFFGGAYALSKGDFLRVDIIYSKFKGVNKRIMDIINGVIALIYITILTYFCYSLFLYSFKGHVVSIYFSQTPLFYPQSIMVLGSIMLLLQVITELINDLFFWRDGEENAE